jgi:hypothetical protein
MGDPEVALQMLQSDLQRLDDRARDDKFAGELYRGLAGNRVSKEGETVAPSWKRAADLVNGLRRGVNRPPLALEQTGGEGWVSDAVAGELQRLGWRVEPLDTGGSDPAHASSPESPPPPDHGERQAPPADDVDWSGLAEPEGRPRRGGKS